MRISRRYLVIFLKTGNKLQSREIKMRISRVLFACLICSATTAWASWNYKTDNDAISGKSGKTAYTESLNKIHDGSGNDRSALLVVGSHPRFGFKIGIALSGAQFSCGAKKCEVTIKLDNQKERKIGAFVPDDGSTNSLLLAGGYDLLSKIMDSKSLVVEAQIFRGGYQTMRFDVANLAWEKPFAYQSNNAEALGLVLCMKKIDSMKLGSDENMAASSECQAYPARYLSQSEMSQILKANHL